MIMNWKNDPVKPLGRKPTRFNLGGLIKKKITWRRSIDSLSATLDHVQIDLPDQDHHHDKQDMNAILGNPSGSQDLSLDSTAHGPDSSDTYSTERLSAATSTTSYPQAKNYTHIYHTEERYTSFTTECISLLNSDMTLHMEYDNADYDDDNDQESLLAPNTRATLSSQAEMVAFDPKAEECVSEYRIGGYHPVKIGDQYVSGNSRYQVLRKLGWGHFSTVWLCIDNNSGQYVALKIVKLGKNYTEAAKDEIAILHTLQGEEYDEDDCDCEFRDTHLVKLLDDFEIKGPNGLHLAMVFELMGENMLHLMHKYKAAEYTARSLRETVPQHLLRLDLVRLIAFQLLLLVDYMHRRGIIHTDLKPENILMKFSGPLREELLRTTKSNLRFQIQPSQPLALLLSSIESTPMKVKVADLGNATYTNLHFTNHIQTRQYRAPEIILKHRNWGALADVWSIGCLLFELMTGDYLFDPHSGQSFSKDEDHLAQIIELLGDFPSKKYLADCELTPKYFRECNEMENIPTLKFWSLKQVLIEKYKYDFKEDSVQLACDVILKCLKFETCERYDCGSLLAHPWFAPNARFVQHEVDLLPNHNSEIHGFVCEE